MLAALGIAQVSALEDRVARRRAIFARYQAALSDLPGLSFMPEAAWGRASRWLSVLLVDPAAFGADRETLRRSLDHAGIESRPVWKPLHLQPAFRAAPRLGGARAAALFDRGLCLPSGSGLSPAEQDRVIDVIRACARP